MVHGDTLIGVGRDAARRTPGRSPEPSGVVSTPFGLTLYASSDSGGVRAVAAALLYASPPADRLARGLAQRIPGSEVTEGFVFTAPTDSAGPDALRYSDAGRPLFVARALVPSADEVRERMRERARVRVGVALLVALVALLAAASRREAGALATIGAVLVVLRCIAVVPLSVFSTRSRLFDASVYFLREGRAFTSNAAALTLTSATLLLAALLVVRRRAARSAPRSSGRRSRSLGVVLGPYLVRTLSRGIAPPAEGAGVALWLIWDVPLCLAATTLLVLAAWGGRAALDGTPQCRHRRGARAGDARGDRRAARLDGARPVAGVVRAAVGRRGRSARGDASPSLLAPLGGVGGRAWRYDRRVGGDVARGAWSSRSATCAGSPVPTRPSRRSRIGSRRG